jgi:glycosyltransferase involved in cell wall biosynthesis
MKSLSVIICTHNPRSDYLQRTLDALGKQTLPKEQWELLLVDNDSKDSLKVIWDLSWHPHARHIRENELGLTHARLRGIQESRGDLIIFVDDDNILDPDYLEQSMQIGMVWPILGAWGGQLRPEFETQPPDWTKPYWGLLAIREFDRDRWSNLLNQHETTPCGAGMCVRRKVAEAYASAVNESVHRLALGRSGASLASCEDTDLAYTAVDLSLGTGQFVALKATHLIPALRVSESYLLRLVEAVAYSSTILCGIRGQLRTRPNSVSLSLLRRFYYLIKYSRRERSFLYAELSGRRRAFREMESFTT